MNVSETLQHNWGHLKYCILDTKLQEELCHDKLISPPALNNFRATVMIWCITIIIWKTN